jgi:hypothetical protein
MDGNMTYTGVFTGADGNAWAGGYVTITGFTSTGNNVPDYPSSVSPALISASTDTTITVYNNQGTAEGPVTGNVRVNAFQLLPGPAYQHVWGIGDCIMEYEGGTQYTVANADDYLSVSALEEPAQSPPLPNLLGLSLMAFTTGIMDQDGASLLYRMVPASVLDLSGTSSVPSFVLGFDNSPIVLSLQRKSGGTGGLAGGSGDIILHFTARQFQVHPPS